MSAIAMSERIKTAIELGESHFREFKSALEGAPGQKTKRKIKDIATNISQTLVAFANADGGELIVGVEDSGEITGLPDFNQYEINQLEESPVTRVHSDTPLPMVRKHKINLDGRDVLYFSVSKSTQFVHVTSDGRCLQRRDLESVPVSAEAVQFDRRERASREYDREYVDGVSADDLDLELVKIVSDQIMKGMSAEKCLQYLELGEYGLSQLRLRRAALLLFSKHPSKWHPRLQIRILKVDGDVINTGEEYNVISDNIVSGNIITLADRAWEALRPHLVYTKFDKSARFEQKSIYPELACREALLNAIAHRDYSDEGKGIEVYIFNNHLKFVNPGALLSSIRVEDIVDQKGVHQSRNSHIARVLRELGHMRELGEGMRRIFDLMHRNELAAPAIESGSDRFTITLTHRPLYSDRDLLWLSNFDKFNLDREQKSVVLLGEGGHVFSAQQVWDAVGIVDTEHYRKLVDSLMRHGILINSIDREKAKSIARSKRIPFRSFQRYKIIVPNEAAKIRESIVDESDFSDASKRIFVGGVSRDADKTAIYDAFSSYGEVSEIYLPMTNGGSKGYCFVEFASSEIASSLISTGRVKLGDRTVVIRMANSKARHN